MIASTIEEEAPAAARRIRTLLPLMPEWMARFLNDGWEPQEVRHADLLVAHREQLGLNGIATSDRIPPAVRLAGRFAAWSPGMHDWATYLYAHEAALSERESAGFYADWARGLQDLGETILAQTFIGPTGRQESGHLGVFRQIAQETWPKLSRPAQWMARQLITRTYVSVGLRAGAEIPERRRVMGHALLNNIGGDVGALARITDPVEQLAAKLLGDVQDDLPSFVRDRYTEYIDLYRSSSESSEPSAVAV